MNSKFITILNIKYQTILTMKTTSWLRVFSLTLLFHILITSSTSLSLSTYNKKGSKGEINAIERREPSNQKHLSEKEDSGEARWMSSYIFPIFPQFYNLDYNSVWNFLKRSDTIGYFVIRDIISVSNLYTIPSVYNSVYFFT